MRSQIKEREKHIKKQNLRWTEMKKKCRFCWILPIRLQINWTFTPSQISLSTLSLALNTLVSLLFLAYAKHSAFSRLWPLLPLHFPQIFAWLAPSLHGVFCSSERPLLTISSEIAGHSLCSLTLLYFCSQHLSFHLGSSVSEFLPTFREQIISIYVNCFMRLPRRLSG